MTEQNIYIDADIFWHATAFDKRKCEEKLGEKNLHTIAGSCANSEITAIVPQVIVGECLVNAFNKEIDIEEVIRFFEILNPNLESPSKEIFLKAHEFMQNDYDLTGNDTLFISHALCNPLTSVIVSTEGTFRTSQPILEAIRNHPRRPKVRSTFRKV